MKNILIIGGGAMGSAFTIPCIDNKNRVTITEPYSKIFIKNLSSKNKFHSALMINLSKKLKFREFSSDLLNEKFDLIVIALSLSGIDFIGKQLKNLRVKSPILVLTKGLKYEKKKKRICNISDQNIKNSYRSFKNNDQKIKIFSKNLPVLESDTQNIIEYVNQTNKKKKKKFNFWKLLEND